MAAILYITEYATLGIDPSGYGQVPGEPPLVASQTITASGSSQQSAPFQPATRYVRLHCDVGGPVCVLFGTNPTATVTEARMAPNQTEYHAVPRGPPYGKVAVITASA